MLYLPYPNRKPPRQHVIVKIKSLKFILEASGGSNSSKLVFGFHYQPKTSDLTHIYIYHSIEYHKVVRIPQVYPTLCDKTVHNRLGISLPLNFTFRYWAEESIMIDRSLWGFMKKITAKKVINIVKSYFLFSPVRCRFTLKFEIKKIQPPHSVQVHLAETWYHRQLLKPQRILS
jgi:hypothetical protein